MTPEELIEDMARAMRTRLTVNVLRHAPQVGHGWLNELSVAMAADALAVVREHDGQALAEAQTRITELAATPDLRAAALLFRNPEGFEPLAEALGIADDTEARGKLDAAFKAVARNAKEKPDGNA